MKPVHKISDVVRAALYLDEISDCYRVGMNAEQVKDFIRLAEPCNCATENNLTNLINAIERRMIWLKDRKEDSYSLLNYEIGNEGSRVLYVSFVEPLCGMGTEEAAKIAADFKKFAKRAKADEFSDESREMVFNFRFWWD